MIQFLQLQITSYKWQITNVLLHSSQLANDGEFIHAPLNFPDHFLSVLSLYVRNRSAREYSERGVRRATQAAFPARADTTRCGEEAGRKAATFAGFLQQRQSPAR